MEPLISISEWDMHKEEASAHEKADRVGFEPTVELIALRRFSKPVPSAARPPVLR